MSNRRRKKGETERKRRKEPVRKGITRRELLKLLIGGLTATVVGGGIFGLLRYLSRKPELTLENAKRSSNPEFVQSYLNRILETGKVTFQNTPVIYDPNFSESIKFWVDQSVRYPEHRDLIERNITDTSSRKLVLDIVRRGLSAGRILYRQDEVIPFGARAKGFDGSSAVFVYYLPYFAITDDDILWQLEHERCHAEIQSKFTFPVPTGYTVEEMQKAAQAIIDSHEVEEARCYTHQFKNVERFDVTRETYNNILEGYKNASYNALKRKAAGSNIESWIIRQLLEKEFVNPYQLQVR